MEKYIVEMQMDKQEKFYFIRENESGDIVYLPSKYLMHKKRSKISPNTIRRSAFALSYYLNFLDEKQLCLDDIYQMKYIEQHEHFTDFLIWLKAGMHSREDYLKLPNNETCNAYLKEVFRFYTFMEQENKHSESLKVLSDTQMIVRNSIGIRKVLNRKSFRGYLKEKGHQGKTIEQDKIVVLLQECANSRDQVLLLLLAETGFRIGELLGVRYAEDIDYEKHIIYELDCCKVASEEQIQRMRISPERYFNLEGLPSEELAEKLEEFIWERGKMLAPSSMASEVTYYNNIREFLIDRKIQSLDAREEEKIIRMLKGWMLERGYALSSKKYRPAYDKIGIESPGIVRHMKKILKFLEEEDDRDEQEKDIWTLKNFDFPIYGNPIKNTETINFTKIVQPDIREEVKKVIFMHLKYSPLGTIHSEIAAVKRFSKFLKRKHLDIQSLQDLERMHIEEYLIYLQTEAHDRKNYRSDLYALRRVIEDVGNLYERQYMSELFLSNDFPSTPRHVFKFYSDAEIKRLNEHIFKMDEQICRALIIHQLLGTRISDTLTLKTDCLSMRNNRYFIRIDQVKSVTYEKAISEEVAQLIMKAIDYTKERYGETTYIFTKKEDPTRPYQYSMIQNRIMTMIRQEDIRDDNGEFLKFGTHIFRHCYGKKLTEMHVDDWMIAKLLGHTSIYSVHHYRKIGNKLMADETRAAREKMDMILLDIIEGWDDYEI